MALSLQETFLYWHSWKENVSSQEFISSVPEENLMAISWISPGTYQVILFCPSLYGLSIMFVQEKWILQMSAKVFLKSGIKMYAFCRWSKFVTFEHIKGILYDVFKFQRIWNLDHMQNAFYVFKYNRLRTPAECTKNIIPFFGNIYPDICSIFLYKHYPKPQRLNWTK